MTYKKEYVEAFLEKQGQLFDEPVAQTLEEADEFLDECMAYVASNYKEVKEYERLLACLPDMAWIQ